jgi:nucleotide-binding universal stress UspA family protein
MATPQSGLPARALVVPLDGSERSAEAARAAARLAPQIDAAVHLVSVASTQGDQEASRRQFDVVSKLVPSASREVVMTDEHHVGAEEVGRSILQAATGAGGVVCMASHGRGRSAGILGSIATEITARAAHPVAIVGPAFAPKTWRVDAPVVACVDGTPPSELVIPIALEWAGALDVSLSVVTVAEPIPAPLPGRPWRRLHGPNEDAETYMARVLECHRSDRVRIDGAVVYDSVSVARGLVDHLALHPASVITVATHARRGMPRFVLGSGAAAIVHQAPVPVLAVPLPHEQ